MGNGARRGGFHMVGPDFPVTYLPAKISPAAHLALLQPRPADGAHCDCAPATFPRERVAARVAWIPIARRLRREYGTAGASDELEGEVRRFAALETKHLVLREPDVAPAEREQLRLVERAVDEVLVSAPGDD